MDSGEMYGVIIGGILTVVIILSSAFMIYKCCHRRCEYETNSQIEFFLPFEMKPTLKMSDRNCTETM